MRSPLDRRPGNRLARGLALGVASLGLAGCATLPAGYETISLAAFETVPDSALAQGMTIRLADDSEITLVRAEDPPPPNLASWPPADSLGYYFVVSRFAAATPAGTSGEVGGRAVSAKAAPRETTPTPLISCTLTFAMTGGGGFWSGGPPGAGGMWISLPGEFCMAHKRQKELKCDALENVGGYVLCRCQQAESGGYGPSYFCRNPGFEKLIDKPSALVHAGYSILDGAFSVIVPKERILSFERRLAPTDTTDADAPSASLPELPTGPKPPHRGFSNAFVDPPEDYADLIAASARRSLDSGRFALEGMVGRCSSYDALPLSLCLAVDGKEEAAIRALEEGIAGCSKGFPFWHGEVMDHYGLLTLMNVARGEIEEAVDAAGNLLHMERPDWFFSDDPLLFLPVARPSLLASFLDRIESPLRANWPRFMAEMRKKLGGQEPGRAPTATADAGGLAASRGAGAWPLPTSAEDCARAIEARMSHSLRRGLFHRRDDANEIEALLEQALALYPSDTRLRLDAVSVALARYAATDDRLGQALDHAEALLSLDVVQGHQARAMVREAAADGAGAEADLRQVIEMEPGDVEHQYDLGFFFQHTRQFEKAFTVFAAIAAADSQQIEADYQYARTAVFARDKVAEGIVHLRRYLAHAPVSNKDRLAWAHLRLGRLHALAGQSKEARKEYDTALELDPLRWQATTLKEALKYQDPTPDNPR